MSRLGKDTQTLLDEFAAGEIDRRSLLVKLFALGISAPAAYALIGELSEGGANAASFKSAIAANPFDLEKKFDFLRRVISSDQVAAFIDKMQTESDAEKVKDAQHLYNDIFKDASFYGLNGTSPPSDMLKISMRVFETTPFKELYAVTGTPTPGHPDEGTLCASYGGLGLCVSYGS